MKNLTAKQLAELLGDAHLNAWNDTREWANGRSLAEAWARDKEPSYLANRGWSDKLNAREISEASNGYHMLWLAARYGDIPLAVLVKIGFEAVEEIVKSGYITVVDDAASLIYGWLDQNVTVAQVESILISLREGSNDLSNELLQCDTESPKKDRLSCELAVARSIESIALAIAQSRKSLIASAIQTVSGVEGFDIGRVSDLCRKYIEIEG
jgi:hypothetical protein